MAGSEGYCTVTRVPAVVNLRFLLLLAAGQRRARGRFVRFHLDCYAVKTVLLAKFAQAILHE